MLLCNVKRYLHIYLVCLCVDMYFTLQALCGSEHNMAVDGEYQLNIRNREFLT